MTSAEHYVGHVDVDTTWDVSTVTPTSFTWEYDEGRDRLLSLYQKGKDKQWDAQKRIDWSRDVDPANPAGLPPEYNPFHSTPIWEKMSPTDQEAFDRHFAAWTFSQFLHGEQGAMAVAARIVETVPDLDSKFYAATQTMDEARHVEVYSRFVGEKIGLYYPMNDDLATLLADALRAPEWDYAYLGMQVLIEGLALAAFGLMRDFATDPLAQQLLTYVMQDEARHVAFGRIALKDAYAELSDAERHDREEFVVEGCRLMQSRFAGREVYEHFDLPVDECIEIAQNSEMNQAFQSMLFSRIVPCVKDIGLWGERVQTAYGQMGILNLAGVDLDALMRNDEQVADRFDEARRELDARRVEVDATIAVAMS